MSKCQTVQDENKIEKITVKTRDGATSVPKQVLPQPDESQEDENRG